MHSVYQRLTTLLSNWMSVTLVQLMFVGLAGLYQLHYSHVDPVQLAPNSVVVKPGTQANPGRLHSDYYSKETTRVARVSFDVDADLRPLFAYNTKLLFVSVLVEFASEKYPVNQCVIYDQIVSDKRDAHLVFTNKRSEYLVYDLADALPGSVANMTLQYQVVPWVGWMTTYRSTCQDCLVFPQSKSKSAKSAKSKSSKARAA